MSLNSFRLGLGRVMSSPIGKALVVVIAGLLVFSFVYSGMGSNVVGRGGAMAAGSGSETVATVNGDAITRAEFDQGVDRYQQQAQAFGQPISVLRSAALHATALDDLIAAKLEIQEANKLGLKASDEDIAKARMQVVAQAGLAQKLGLKPNASLSEIDSALAKNGQTSIEDKLPDEAVRQNVLLEKLQTYQANKVPVTEQDARDSYRQYHTRHILIGNRTRSDVQAQAQVQQILAKAQAPGADFAALAKQYSEDPGTKNKGGDDGFIDQNTGYVPEFLAAAKTLKPGGVTMVKSPQYGYFVIKLDAVRSNLPKDFEKKKADYIAQVRQQKQGQARQDFITALKNAPGNKVVVQDPELRADREMADAAKESDSAKQQTGYRAALADYQKSLAARPALNVAGEVNAQMAQAYQALHQTPQAVTAFEAAVQATDDPDLRMELGNLYLKNKQDDKAAAQFQAASKQAWDNQTLHQQLLMTYLQMKRPDLIAQERDWLKQYQDRQKQASMPFSSAPPPGAAPTGPAPASGAAPAPQAVQVVPSDAPGPGTVRPAGGAPPPPAKTPAQ